MKQLNEQDIHDILYGCVILGTGGGGDMSHGLQMIEHATALKKKFILADIDEIPDDSMIVTPYALGAISALPEDELKKYQNLPIGPAQPFMSAINKLEQHIGRPVYGAIACEMGGHNTAVPMFIAAMKDGVILNADTAGRAVPEVQNSTYYIHNLPVSPIVVSNEFGEVAIYENIKDDARAETILRSFAMESKNNIAVIDHALPMKDLKHAIIPGTLSKALHLGKAFRTAHEANENVARTIADSGGGKVVFTGTVTNFEWKTESGFTIGSVRVNGIGKSSGNELKIWFKNENLISWLNEEVFVTLPDLICLINTDTGEPITNPNFKNAMNIAMIVYPAPEIFTTEKGLMAFGPKRFGFDIEYKPAINRIESI